MNLKEIREKYSEKEIAKIKKNSREITVYAGDSLDKIVLKLEKLRREGKINCYVNFNGTKIYSIDVTMDKAYKECLGCSRRQWLERQKKWAEEIESNQKKWQKQAQEKLPKWIQEGKKYMHPEKFANWEKLCNSSVDSDYYGLEIEKALEIMEMLENNISFNEIKKKINESGHSGMTYSRTMNIVLNYSKLGPLFYTFMNKKNMSIYDIKYVEKIKELNHKLYYGQTYINACEDLKEHKIMEISILSNYNETDNSYKYQNGTILINEDLTFEGIIENNNYITGKFIKEGLTFASFSNSKNISNYLGIKQNDKIVGTKQSYLTNQNKDQEIIIIELTESSKTFASEIELEYKMDKLKRYFKSDVKDAYDSYIKNIDSEIYILLKELKENLNQLLINTLKNRVEELSINNSPVKKLTLIK